MFIRKHHHIRMDNHMGKYMGYYKDKYMGMYMGSDNRKDYNRNENEVQSRNDGRFPSLVVACSLGRQYAALIHF